MKWILKNKQNNSEIFLDSHNEISSFRSQEISCQERSSKEVETNEVLYKRNQRFISVTRKKNPQNSMILEQNYRWRSSSATKSFDDPNIYIAVECQAYFENTLVVSSSFSLDTYYEGLEHRVNTASQHKLLLKSPITGKVLKVSAGPGNHVKKGDVLFIIEAMKMENRILSPQDALVKSIKIQVGSNVQNGQVLGELENE